MSRSGRIPPGIRLTRPSLPYALRPRRLQGFSRELTSGHRGTIVVVRIRGDLAGRLAATLNNSLKGRPRTPMIQDRLCGDAHAGLFMVRARTGSAESRISMSKKNE